MIPLERVLIVVAHPDDEIIFFGSLVMDLARAGTRVDVVCATGSFGNSFQTSTRRAEFQRACWRAGAQGCDLGLEDSSGELPLIELEARLGVFASHRGPPLRVFTHGVWGEYGHRHHRDVCLAVHRVFGDRVLSLAGPFRPEFTKILTPDELERKRRITATTYYSQPFAEYWCSSEERFARVAPCDVEVLYRVAAGIPPGVSPARLSTTQELGRASLAAFESDEIPFPDVASIPASIWKPAHALFAGRSRAFLGIT